MMRRAALVGGVLACGVLAPATAHAHLVSTRFGDFYDGMLHPVTSLEHMVPWLALGLLMGARPKAGRWGLLSFPVGLALGAVLGWLVPGLSGFGTANMASILMLGGLVALDLPLPALVLALLAGAFGVSHGYVNATAMTPTTNPMLFAPGVVAAGYLIILMASAVAALAALQWPGARIVLRALGSWTFAIGVLMLGTALA